jgi:hypothetical protein
MRWADRAELVSPVRCCLSPRLCVLAQPLQSCPGENRRGLGLVPWGLGGDGDGATSRYHNAGRGLKLHRGP